MTPAEATIVEIVMDHPGGSVTDVAQRTGLAQSHVSVLVARLRDRDILETVTDPADGRRTLIQVSRRAQRAIANRAQRSVDDALLTATGDLVAARRAAELLDELAQLLVRNRVESAGRDV